MRDSSGVSNRPAVRQAKSIRSLSCRRHNRTVPSYAALITQRLSGEIATCATRASCPRNTTGAALGSAGSHCRTVPSSLADTSHLPSWLNDTDAILPAWPLSSTGANAPGFFRSISLSVLSQEPKAAQRPAGSNAAWSTRSLNAVSDVSFGSAPAARSHSLPFLSKPAVAAQRPSGLMTAWYTTSPCGSVRGAAQGSFAVRSHRYAERPWEAVAKWRPSALKAGSRTGTPCGQRWRGSNEGLAPETSHRFTVPPHVPLTIQRLSGLKRSVLTSPHSFSDSMSGGCDKSARRHRLITPLS
ncbi:hypothetical protein D9M68_593380 [compost metagenome]